MPSRALTLVTPDTPPRSAQSVPVARNKSIRGSDGSGTDARAAAEALAAAREAERGYVLAAQECDSTAFAKLVRRHQQRAYAVARAVLLSHEDAEDAVQEGFLHAHRALSRFRPDQPFGAWLHRIISNAALDLARRRKVRDTDELVDTHASPFRDPAEADELHDRLRSALAQLPDRQRSVLVLHDVEGYKHAEIGELLGIPEGTARSDLHHARASMRTILGSLRRPA
jgi:RNA polymerase sigma-70 factor, ECF subfamily